MSTSYSKTIKGKEAQIRNAIEGQEQRIAKAQKRIEELNLELSSLLSAVPDLVTVVDKHNYCGKILYVSRKAANAARKLINRDLTKMGKTPMKRAYLCKQCEAWHLTTIPHWMPHPENELSL